MHFLSSWLEFDDDIQIFKILGSDVILMMLITIVCNNRIKCHTDATDDNNMYVHLLMHMHSLVAMHMHSLTIIDCTTLGWVIWYG